MPSSLKTLIKVAKSEVDRKQKELAEVQIQQDHLKKQISTIESSINDEKKIAEKNYEDHQLAASFSSFAAAAQGKIDNLENAVKNLEGTIEILREKLSEAFAEQKKFEIVEAANIKKAKQEAARLEAAKLDEVGTNMFARKEGND